MINKKMEEALNEQINAEIYSSYLYLSMSAWFDSRNFAGFAKWMEVQAREEHMHAMKIFKFIQDRNGTVKLMAIAEPPIEWDSPVAAFKAALDHEKLVTGRINALMDLALAENDHASKGFLQWFVDEQVEEEATADTIVQRLELVKDFPAGIFMMDRELGARGAA